MHRLALLAAAAVLLGVALMAQLGAMLFAFHMAQHLLLIAIAAPLLVLGGVQVRLPPAAGWLLFVSVFLFWHWPAAFQWAAASPGLNCWRWPRFFWPPCVSGAAYWATAG